ncbi:MAG: hypothetical protein EON52_05965 [Actinomycetales bacterium]|nr:MAG: hypothetical protein EON52_05965 [Actinomycetales bacterium]
MKRLALGLAAAGMSAVVLAGCGGGGNPYCDTVEKSTDTLNSFGKTKSNAAYTKYASTFRAIAKESPTTVKDDWTALAKATDTVLSAQKDVGLRLEQMTSAAAVKKLSTADLKKLNTAYKAFNATNDQRTAVVKNVKQECKITLT